MEVVGKLGVLWVWLVQVEWVGGEFRVVVVYGFRFVEVRLREGFRLQVVFRLRW